MDKESREKISAQRLLQFFLHLKTSKQDLERSRTGITLHYISMHPQIVYLLLKATKLLVPSALLLLSAVPGHLLYVRYLHSLHRRAASNAKAHIPPAVTTGPLCQLKD